MAIETEQLRNIAWLARLATPDEGIEQYRRDVDNILGLVEQINAAETTGVAPLAHPLDIQARLRPDAVTEGDQREKFQAIAPEVEQGYYLVPRVIE